MAVTVDNEIMDQLIEDVTSDINNFMARKLIYTAGTTEYLTGDGGNVLGLTLYPVFTITSVTIATDRDFDNGDTLTVEEDYRFNPANGLIYYESGNWPRARLGIKVVYSAGYRHPDDTVMTAGYEVLPDAIRGACVTEVVARYNRRKSPEIEGEKAGDGNVTMIARGQLLPDVAKRLAYYRRPIL